MLKGVNKHYDSVLIPYGFIHFAYFVLLLTPFTIRNGKFSSDYARPLFLISSLYFLTVLIVGCIFIAAESEKSTAVWLTQIGLLGIFAAWFISNLIANEHTANATESHEQELLYVKVISSQLKSIMNQIKDSKTNKQVEQLYDYIHSSPIKSSNTVTGIERNIMFEIDNLFNAVHLNNNISIAESTNKMMQMAMERNRKLNLIN